MTKKDKVQRFFDESGISEQLKQLLMSGALPGVKVRGYSDEITAKIHEINARHALAAASKAYGELFTGKEIDELIAIYKQPVMKKSQEHSAYAMKAAAQQLFDDYDQIEQEIAEMIQNQETSQ